MFDKSFNDIPLDYMKIMSEEVELKKELKKNE